MPSILASIDKLSILNPAPFETKFVDENKNLGTLICQFIILKPWFVAATDKGKGLGRS